VNSEVLAEAPEWNESHVRFLAALTLDLASTADALLGRPIARGRLVPEVFFSAASAHFTARLVERCPG
jgi:hypothetical protein